MSQISIWRSAYAIFVQWLVISIMAYAAVHFDQWTLYVGALVVIATRQHALGVLMHEAAHYRLFSNRPLNDWISDFFLSYSVGLSTRLYRNHHASHHFYVNSVDDPDWQAIRADDEN